MHVVQLPGPGFIVLPSLLNGSLHDFGLPKVALLYALLADQYATQEQPHIGGLGHVLSPM